MARIASAYFYEDQPPILRNLGLCQDHHLKYLYSDHFPAFGTPQKIENGLMNMFAEVAIIKVITMGITHVLMRT